MKKIKVPKDFLVRPLRPSDDAFRRTTCGTCGLSWDDGIVTAITPAPASRCPFEQFHVYDDTPKVAAVGSAEWLEAIALDLLDAHGVIDELDKGAHEGAAYCKCATAQAFRRAEDAANDAKGY